MSQLISNSATYDSLRIRLLTECHTWLVTGVAGFIGSNLLEELLKLNQNVVGLDSFATGHRENLSEVQLSVSEEQWSKFRFIEGDIRNKNDCELACNGVEYVLHQAALGSVPRSIGDPITTNDTNIGGFLNMLVTARNAKVKSFTYAASSSTYGDHAALPKEESTIGRPLSPYAVTKYVNELYADVFSRAYEFNSIGLRYFNVFGKRQDPQGAYAAVIPKWINAMLNRDPVRINGSGETSRDFCFIANVVQANILSALTSEVNKNEIYNVAFGGRTTLIELFELIKIELAAKGRNYAGTIEHLDFRAGDVMHSQADISKAKEKLDYVPSHDVRRGMRETVEWFVREGDQQK